MNLSSLPRNFARFCLSALLCFHPLALWAASPGSLDLSFDPDVQGGSAVYASATQPDGKILLGGNFSSVGGTLHTNLARLNPDGTVDSTFTASAGSIVYSILVQPDGKIVIGGTFTTVNGLTGRPYLARLNIDGTLDTSFSAALNSFVVSVVMQTDGRLLIGGNFTTVNGADCRYLARLNADGSRDTTFDTSGALNSTVNSLALQIDGKLVAGGSFFSATKAGGNYLARFNSDGKLDTDFNALGSGLNGSVSCVAIQPDGKIILGGGFTTYNGTSGINRITRLKPDGTRDTNFNARGTGADGQVNSAALQTDGKILISGSLTAMNGTPVNRMTRLNDDGSLDMNFGPMGTGANNTVYGVRLLGDGRILSTGLFTGANNVLRNRVAVFTNDDATTSLIVTREAPQGIRWHRSGALPELSDVTFEVSAVKVGLRVKGTRDTTGDWFWEGSLPSRGTVLARGRVSGGYNNGSGSLIEVSTDYTLVVPTVRSGTAEATAKSARVQSKVSSNGGATTAVFEYSQDPAMASGIMLSAVTSLPKDAVLTNVEATLENLVPHRTYYYRLRATNDAGSIFGPTASFTTGNSEPVANRGTFSATTGDAQRILLPATDADDDALEVRIMMPTEHLSVNRFDGLTITVTPAADYVGTTTLVYSVNDGFGGEASSSITVNIADNDAPVIAPYAPAVLRVSQGGVAMLPDYRGEAEVVDNVATIEFTQSPAAGTPVREGNTLVKFAARDAAGNESEASFVVSVVVNGSAALAERGAEILGAGVDPRVPAGTVWRLFGVPSLAAHGTRAGWLATGQTLTGRIFRGIFAGPLEAPSLRLCTGEPAWDEAGAPVPGSTFEHFRDPVLAGEDFAVLATVRQDGLRSHHGLWVGQADGSVRRIALEGAAAPGTETRFTAFTSAAMPAPGVVFFTARLQAAKEKNFGLWRWTATTGTQRVFVKGDLVEVGGRLMAIDSIQTLSSVPGSPGHARYAGESGMLDVRLRFAGVEKITALATVAPDGAVHIGRHSGKLGDSGLVALDFGIPSSSSTEAAPSVIASIFKGLTAARKIRREPMIFDLRSQAVIANLSTPAPGLEPARFANFSPPVCADGMNGRITAFTARTTGELGRRLEGVWAYTDRLAVVAWAGIEPPGASGTRWERFRSLTVQEERGVMFTATLRSGTKKVTRGTDAGLWGTDSTGALRLIFRKGDEVRPGKFLRSFDVLEAVAGSPGQRRAWAAGDASARVIYRAFFTDGTSAIVSTAVP